jgi:hypothetical protein
MDISANRLKIPGPTPAGFSPGVAFPAPSAGILKIPVV